MPPKANPKSRQKKLLVYAGVAGAVIALLMLMKRKGGEAAPAEAEPAGTTYASSPSGIPAAGETGNLAAFENSLSEQLPGAIAAGVQAGMVNNSPASTTNLPELITSLGSFLGSVQGSRTGEQTGAGAQQSPSQGTTPTQVAPAPQAPTAPTPVASSPPKGGAAPAGCPPGFPNRGPHGCYKNGTCGNGCPGHFYSTGSSECATKNAKTKKCEW